MEIALYDPSFGYYGSGKALLGRAGDYFTSVSVGPVFGELLATQFHEMWTRLGEPIGFAIVEQGANDGAFAADVLAWIRAEAPGFFEALRYEIVENIEALERRQRDRLAEFAGKTAWRSNIDALPPFTGVHFSNELIDAFPVHLVRFREGQWRELYVTSTLAWSDQPAEGALLARLADVPRLEGYTTEVNLEALRWARALAPKIERGWVMAIDYGLPRDRYYTPERREGTLQCYAGHTRGLDPLSRPGFCDLTAHVEFTSLASAFMDTGLDLAGYTDQHHFLAGLAARAFAGQPPSAKQARELKTLLHPEMLGASFKVLAMSRGVPEERLTGFQFARDPRRELGLVNPTAE